MTRLIDLTGKTFYQWTVINRDETSATQGTMWNCQCICGSIKLVNGKNLRSGGSKSCGCIHQRSKELTKKQLHQLLAYNAKTGVFTWKVDRKKLVKAGEIAGHRNKKGYIDITVDGFYCPGHRLAWFYVHGAWPTNEIDHIDGNRSNNAIANLRDVSRTINQQNQKRARSNNKSSGVLGVSKDRNSWVARIRANGSMHSSSHPTKELAAAAYLSAKRQLHQGNTL